MTDTSLAQPSSAVAGDRVPRRSGVPPTVALTLLVVVVMRLAVLTVGIVSVRLATPTDENRFYLAHPWLAFDARGYRYLAIHGYATDRAGVQWRGGSTFTLIAYFPVWPMLSRQIATILPIDAGMVLASNFCSLAGFALVYDWARRVAGHSAAVLCVLITAAFPGAVSMSAGATEGPFLLLVGGVLWLLQARRFWAAAIVASIATATRPTGVALAMVVPVYAWLSELSVPIGRRICSFVLLGTLSVSGGLAYEGFLWHRYHSPTAYFEAQDNWNHLDRERLQGEAASGVKRGSAAFYLRELEKPQVWNRGLAAVLLLLIVAGFFNRRGIPPTLMIFPLVTFLMTSLPGHGLRISSVPRYESAAVPVFLLLSVWLTRGDGALRSDGDEASLTPQALGLVGLLFIWQLYYAFLFTRYVWVG